MTSEVLKMRPGVEDANTGIDDRKMVASNMAACLSDSYLLMIKTQGYHWNVVGPLFHSIHVVTEEHYEDMFPAIDELAERIRALGYPAPSSISEMISLSGLEENSDNPTTEEMIKNLVRDHQAVARRFREAAEHAGNAGDVVSEDMLTGRIAFHEKAVWMLTALLNS